jgi:hypothetical protein
MKKIYALSLGLMACTLTHAQISKGSIVLGGNLSYDNQANNADYGSGSSNVLKSNTLNINPSIAKAIRDNLLLGVDLSYLHGSSTNNGNGAAGTSALNGFSVGFFFRRYKPIGSGFSLFGQAELSGGYTHNHATNQVGSPTDDITNTGSGALNFYPGIAYALNRHWQIETGLANFLTVSYIHSRETISNTNQPDQFQTDHNFNLTSGLSGSDFFTVGVRYIIGGK